MRPQRPLLRAAHEEEAARHAGEEDRHVLAPERPRVRLDVLVPSMRLATSITRSAIRGVVDGCAVDALVAQARGHAARGGRALDDALDLLRQGAAGRLRERARRARQPDGARDDVERGAAVDGGDRDDGGVERRDFRATRPTGGRRRRGRRRGSGPPLRGERRRGRRGPRCRS